MTMADTDTTAPTVTTPDSIPGGPLVVPSPPNPDPDPKVKLPKSAKPDPETVCPTCGALLNFKRMIPDFLTHVTRFCERCGFSERVASPQEPES